MTKYELEFHQNRLHLYDNIIKDYESGIKRLKFFIIFYIFNTILYCWITSLSILSSKSIWIIITNSVITIIWFSGAMLMLYSIKQRKIALKEHQISYDEELKIVDYPKYIKDDRLKKIKKLKSSWFS